MFSELTDRSSLQVERLVASTRELSGQLDALSFSAPVTHVYNPLDYAFEPFRRYVEAYGGGKKSFVILGMNPGPWGMAQTGVPFGEIEAVEDWLAINAAVGQPRQLHPKRPITGFATTRREVSGQRVWGWAKERFGTPAAFFGVGFVLNYCPLLFFDEDGTNITPDKLKTHDRAALFQCCDRAFSQQVELLGASVVIALGRFAFDRASQALAGSDVSVLTAPHPSPANPAANAGWFGLMDSVFRTAFPNLP